MDDLHLKQTEKRCFSVLSGTSKNSEEFMDSPTFFLSRAAMRDRLWLLIFLEALIAIENGSEDFRIQSEVDRGSQGSGGYSAGARAVR